MKLTRRLLLGGILAAPAIVRASSLMAIVPVPKTFSVHIYVQTQTRGFDFIAGSVADLIRQIAAKKDLPFDAEDVGRLAQQSVFRGSPYLGLVRSTEEWEAAAVFDRSVAVR